MRILYRLSLFFLVFQLSFGKTNAQKVPSFSYIDNLDRLEALDTLHRLIRTNFDNKDVGFYKAWRYYVNGKIGVAYNEVNEYLKLPHKKYSYESYILLGKIQQARLTPNLSIIEIDKAISMNNTRQDAYIEKAKIYAYSRKIQEGIDFINKALKKFPSTVEFYLYRGLILKEKSLKKSYPDFKKTIDSNSIESNKLLSEAYFGIAQYFLNDKKYNDALEQTERGLELSPNYHEGYGLRGEIKFYLDDLEGAIGDLKKLERDKGEFSYYWTMMGDIYSKLGETEEACHYYNMKCSLFVGDKACAKRRKLKCTK